MNHDEMIAVIQAHRDGEKVEQRRYNGRWMLMGDNYTFAFNDGWEYRIKPEPKVIWVNESSGGNYYPHRSKERAMAMSEGSDEGWRIAVKYIEVIDE